MDVTNSLHTCKNYFSGIQDLRDHKTAHQTLIGFCKCISYATVIIPLAFATVYWSCRTVKKLHHQRDLRIISDVLTDVFPKEVNHFTRGEQLQILLNQAEQLPQDSLPFRKKFSKTSPKIQAAVFSRASPEVIRKMNQALEGSQNIAYASATDRPDRDQDMFSLQPFILNQQLRKNHLIAFLESIDPSKLSTLTLDLSSLGYCTSFVVEKIAKKIKNEDTSYFEPQDLAYIPEYVTAEDDGKETNYNNLSEEIAAAICWLLDAAKKNPSLSYSLKLKNMTLSYNALAKTGFRESPSLKFYSNHIRSKDKEPDLEKLRELCSSKLKSVTLREIAHT